MQPNLKRRAIALAAGSLAFGGWITSCTTTTPQQTPEPALPPPSPGVQRPARVPAAPDGDAPPAPREFRAAWVSTVANIDWPSKPGLPAEKQQAEALAILDRAKGLNLNAIVLQVRPSADAIYPSTLEPWTEFLTGAQGVAPQPAYDPLKFWVTEAHARGLELHAWFNPYRARHATAKSPVSADHIARTNPSVVKSYGKFLWMDPGEEAASKQTLDVILDVVRRYDIDGVHIDDYFYPYPIDAPGAGGAEAAALDGVNGNAKELDFPDQPAWQRYLLGGGKLDRAGWRRQNVNRLIEAIYTGIHREKSWVRFGISPFGLGRPDRRPPAIAGFSQYDKLYADAELWLENGWVDYFTPQLYWPIAQAPQAYEVLLDYWLGQNRKGRHMWPGLYTSRIGQREKAYMPDEIVQQIAVTRKRPAATGHVHFSMVALMENRLGLADQLKAGHYAVPALVPASPWLGNKAPGAPTVEVLHVDGKAVLKLVPGVANTSMALWTRHGKQWRFNVLPVGRSDWPLDDASSVIVTGVDRLGNESQRVMVSTLKN